MSGRVWDQALGEANAGVKASMVGGEVSGWVLLLWAWGAARIASRVVRSYCAYAPSAFPRFSNQYLLSSEESPAVQISGVSRGASKRRSAAYTSVRCGTRCP